MLAWRVWLVVGLLACLSLAVDHTDGHSSLTQGSEVLALRSPQQPRRPSLDTAPPKRPTSTQKVNAEIGELEPVGSTPSARGGHTMVALNEHTLLVWGGCDLSLHCPATLHAFDVDQESWREVATSGVAPEGRTGHAAWVDKQDNPYMWVFGGFVDNPAAGHGSAEGHFSSDVFALYTSTMRWSMPPVTGELPAPRYQTSLQGVNATHALMFGGSNANSYFDDLHMFNADTFEWVKIAATGDLPSSRESHTATMLSNNDHATQMVIYGGYHHDQCLDDVYSLDIGTMAWKQLSASGGGARGGHVSFVVGSRVFAMGGCNEPQDKCMSDLIMMDPSVGPQWVQADVMDTVSQREWAAAAQSGRRVYVFGGCVPNDKCFNDVWLLEFGAVFAPLHLVSAEVSPAMSADGSAPPAALTATAAQSKVAPVVAVQTKVSQDAGTEGASGSKPGRQMMEKLKEIRKELKLAEDVCSNLPGRSGASNTTGAPQESAPKCDETLSACASDYPDCGYRGCQQTTRLGFTCQAWDCWQTEAGCVNTGGVLDSVQDDWANFQEQFGLGDHNYCRNPDGQDSIWCFTTDPEQPWDLCDPVGAGSTNTTRTLEVCPEGTIPVKLSELNLEMFNMMNASLHSSPTGTGEATASGGGGEEGADAEAAPAEEPAPEAEAEGEAEGEEAAEAEAEPAARHVASLLQLDSAIAMLDLGQDTNTTAGNGTGSVSLMNVTVCFGKTGPVAVLGANLTLADIFRALEFNRTLRHSSRRTGGFMPSPSPSPLPYNATKWVENGRFMGRRVDQGKRRPLAEVANRTERMLTSLNCTTPESATRPECTLPFANLTGTLNATANWTTGQGDQGGAPDDQAAGGADGEAAPAEGEECAPDDADCLARQGGTQEEACAPDDHECLERQGAAQQVVCEEGDAECAAAMTGAGNSTTGTLSGGRSGTAADGEEDDLGAQLSTALEEHGPVVVLGACAFLVAFIAVGATLTKMMKEKRQLAKLEASLKDAQLKQQDEVWTKAGGGS